MSLVSQTKCLPQARADLAARLKMQDSLRSAAEAIETPFDTMLHLFNGVSPKCRTVECEDVHTG